LWVVLGGGGGGGFPNVKSRAPTKNTNKKKKLKAPSKDATLKKLEILQREKKKQTTRERGSTIRRGKFREGKVPGPRGKDKGRPVMVGS